MTMTMARALGLTRVGSARFCFLLAVPGIAMAGGYEFLKLLTGRVRRRDGRCSRTRVRPAGYLCIHVLIKFLGRHGLLPFALYRLLIAVVIVWYSPERRCQPARAARIASMRAERMRSAMTGPDPVPRWRDPRTAAAESRDATQARPADTARHASPVRGRDNPPRRRAASAEPVGPAHRVAGLEQLEQGARPQFHRAVHHAVVTRGEYRELAVIAGHAQACGKLADHRHAGVFVATVRRPLRARRAALAEIVHQCGKSDGRIGRQVGRHLEHEFRVQASVDFGCHFSGCGTP